MVVWYLKKLNEPTFEHRADLVPDDYGAAAVVLAERELHIEEGQPQEDQHQEVGDQERTCNTWSPHTLLVNLVAVLWRSISVKSAYYEPAYKELPVIMN